MPQNELGALGSPKNYLKTSGKVENIQDLAKENCTLNVFYKLYWLAWWQLIFTPISWNPKKKIEYVEQDIADMG